MTDSDPDVTAPLVRSPQAVYPPPVAPVSKAVLWVVMIALLGGVVGAVFNVIGYLDEQNRADEEDRRRIEQIEAVFDYLGDNQECMISLLLIEPAVRIQLSEQQVQQLCPQIEEFDPGGRPVVVAPDLGPTSSTSTTTAPARSVSTVIVEEDDPRPPPSTTTSTSRPPATTTTATTRATAPTSSTSSTLLLDLVCRLAPRLC